ncbi:2246_t:CDS:2 [Funneliformis caledonium]|uniref:2246_t:CDS:1 n=1 Tax=Funneliformis caledonium TaxID=1117310 RepID=A0A9N9GIV9_9GLOM|nr:2246_t:CDS:2 [Funneliformis caledonium]
MSTPKKTARCHSSSQSSLQASEIEVEKIESMLERYGRIQVPKSYVKRTELEKTEQTVEIIDDDNVDADLLLAKNRELRAKLNELRNKCSNLEKKNSEVIQEAKKVGEELNKIKEDFSLLIDINNTFSKKNEELKRRIHSNESDDEFRQKSENKKRNKGKKIASGSDNDKSNDTMRIETEELTEKDEKSARLKDLLRNTFDGHSKKTQTVQPQHSRYYDNDLQSHNYPHPAKASRWTYVTRQNMIYDTEVEEKTGE